MSPMDHALFAGLTICLASLSRTEIFSHQASFRLAHWLLRWPEKDGNYVAEPTDVCHKVPASS